MKKCIGLFAAIFVGVPLVAWLVLLLWGRIAFAQAFSLRTRLAENPGLADGLVPQGLTWNREGRADGNMVCYTVGYMKDGGPTRVYQVSEATGEVGFYPLTSGGSPFYGHTGGLQYHDGWLYLADEGSGVYRFSAQLPSAGETVEIGEPIRVDNNSSFVFADDAGIFVGEFNDGEKYVCRNDVSHNGTNHKAIVAQYRDGDFSAPKKVYSIGDQIQGFARLSDGTVVLSKSYGLSPSRFLVYEPKDQLATGQTLQGAEVVFLGEPGRVIKAPPMSEDLDVLADRVLYMTESASKKYIFGNLYFDRGIYLLDVMADDNSDSAATGLVPTQETAPARTAAALPNPIKAATPQEILETLGVSFAVPPHTQDVRYSTIAGETAQMDFTLDGIKCTARIQAAVQLEDISGMYYSWDKTAECEIGWCGGQVMWQEGADAAANKGVCLWYDAAPGLLHSLSVDGGATENGLVQLANAVYKPTQGDAE